MVSDLRVHHGAPSSKIVGCGTCGSGYNQPIPLHMGHKVAVTEAFQIAEERRYASVYHYFIEDNLLIQMGVVVCMPHNRFA